MKENKELDTVIHNIQKLQLKATFLKGELRKKKMAYTGEEVELMTKMLSFEKELGEVMEDIQEQADIVGMDILMPIFQNKELMQEKYLITHEMQKNIAKEILGYEITVEDYLEKITI